MNISVSSNKLRTNSKITYGSDLFNEPSSSLWSKIALLFQRLTVSTHWHDFATDRAILLESGEIVTGQIMRRRVGNAMEYRPMTEAELFECSWDKANQM